MAEEAKIAAEQEAQNTATSTEGEKNQVVTTVNAEGAKQEDAKKENPYEVEIARLNSLVDALKKEKTGAIHDEREKRKRAEALLKSNSGESAVEDSEGRDALTSRVEELIKAQQVLESKLNEKDVDSAIDRVTNDPKEREAIKAHLKYSLNPTGNIAEDIANARLLANRQVLFELGKKEGLEAKQEEVLARFSAAGSSGGKESRKKIDPEVAEILSKLDPSGKALQYVK